MAKRQHAVKRRRAVLSRSPAGDAFSAFVFGVLRLGGLLGAVGDALAKPAGQTSARWQVLAAVEHAPATVAQIARALGLARQSVQRVADVLAHDGLAAYSDNPADQRSDLVRLTPSGRAALTMIQNAQRVWADELGAHFGERRMREGAELLEEVIEALNERPVP